MKSNNPDRKIQPALRPVNPGKIQEPVVYCLDNGVKVLAFESDTEELLKLEFIFDAGQLFETTPLLSSAVNSMLVEGTENYSAKNLNSALDFYGTFVNPFAEKDASGLSIIFLTKYTGKILELCLEMLYRPAFPEDELIALMKKRYQWYMVNREKVQVLAYDQFFESVFGKVHPYGRCVRPEDFEGITPELLKRFHRIHYSVRNMTIIAAGRIPGGTIELLNRFFGFAPAGEAEKPEIPSLLPGEKMKKVKIRKKSALQSAIRVGSPTINKKHPDYQGLKIVDTILGGYFGSRLMKNIREEKGYTYGIHSTVSSMKLSGYKLISTEVGKDYAAPALNEIYREIVDLQRNPPGEQELAMVRNFMLGEMVRMFDGSFSIADSYRAVWEFGLDNGWYYSFVEKIKTIGTDEIIRLAGTYYNPDEMYEIVAGP